MDFSNTTNLTFNRMAIKVLVKHLSMHFYRLEIEWRVQCT